MTTQPVEELIAECDDTVSMLLTESKSAPVDIWHRSAAALIQRLADLLSSERTARTDDRALIIRLTLELADAEAARIAAERDKERAEEALKEEVERAAHFARIIAGIDKAPASGVGNATGSAARARALAKETGNG